MTERRDRDERVSLHGLDPEEALRALLAVRPDDEPVEDDVVPDCTGEQSGDQDSV